MEEADNRNQADIDRVLFDFPDTFSPSPGNNNIVQMSLTVKEGSVVSLAPYKIPERLRSSVKEQIDKLLHLGIIKESRAHWSSSIVPVLKPSGEVRLCVDFRRLNDITVQEQCYIPDIEDIHQIRMAPFSKDLTTFTCTFGRFYFNRMPFGLKNAPATS